MSFWVQNVLVCLGMVVVDALWALWAAKIAEKKAATVAFTSVAIVLSNSFVVASYIEDRRLIFAAAIGAFVGTYLPLRLAQRSKRDPG